VSTYLAFDFGTKSIGVAVGQTITGTAQPLAAIKANDGIPNWDTITELHAQWQPTAMLVGLPLNMDGTEQEMTLGRVNSDGVLALDVKARCLKSMNDSPLQMLKQDYSNWADIKN
jgi:putative transcription antitermination factor YqgF